MAFFWPFGLHEGQKAKKRPKKKLVSKCLKLLNSSRKSKKNFSNIFGLRSEVAEVRGHQIRTFWGRGSFLHVQANILTYLTSLKVEGCINPQFFKNLSLWVVVLCLFMIPPFVKKLARRAGSNGLSSAAKVIGLPVVYVLLSNSTFCTQN